MTRVKPIEPAVLAVLSGLLIEGSSVKITEQLARPLYNRVNEVLEALGGKWNKKAKAHLFDDDPEDRLDDAIITGRFGKCDHNPLDFYRTQPSLVQKIIEYAELKPGMTVLEPEAGEGDIADAAAAIVGPAEVATIELDEARASILRTKGFIVAQGDFLDFDPNHRRYDRVLMNPPFTRQRDIDHLMHAWEFVKPLGGRLVGIASSSITFRKTSKAIVLRDLIARTGRWIENPPDSFKASGTMVNTVTIILGEDS